MSRHGANALERPRPSMTSAGQITSQARGLVCLLNEQSLEGRYESADPIRRLLRERIARGRAATG